MIEIEYIKAIFLDSAGGLGRTRYGVIVTPEDSHDGNMCAFPFESFQKLRGAINESSPEKLLIMLEEFNCREEAEGSGLLTLNGDYAEIPTLEEEEEDA